LEAGWVQKIVPKADGVFFFSSGVFVYLRMTELKKFLTILADSLPGAELVFDVQSRMSAYFGNFILRRVGMGSARMHWGARSANSIVKQHTGLKLIEEFSVFGKFGDDIFPDRETLRNARMMDKMRAMTIVHLRFGRDRI
jgi:O-methyltransferase involved in polyketide biosynthesis